MDFTLSHARDGVGNRIDVKLVAPKDERITGVKTVLDGATIADDTPAVPLRQYEHIFPMAGAASPGRDHLLVVTARTANGSESAERRWTDDR